MSKSPDAFRTISEVAEWLGIQAHVLRFWESKFSQVKPVKRAGGRRYYRPNDMLLLGGIKRLLHEDGLTIKGVQKILREEGVSHVIGMSQPLDDAGDATDEAAESLFIEAEPEETGVVLSFDGGGSRTDTPTPAEVTPEPKIAEPEEEDAQSNIFAENDPAAEAEAASPVHDDRKAPVEESAGPASEEAPGPAEAGPKPTAAALPAFLRRPMDPQPDATDNAPAAPEPAVPAPPPPTAAPKPRVIEMPTLTPLHEMEVVPGTLSTVFSTRKLSTAQANDIAPLLDRLTILRDSMASRRRPNPNPGAND